MSCPVALVVSVATEFKMIKMHPTLNIAVVWDELYQGSGNVSRDMKPQFFSKIEYAVINDLICFLRNPMY